MHYVHVFKRLMLILSTTSQNTQKYPEKKGNFKLNKRVSKNGVGGVGCRVCFHLFWKLRLQGKLVLNANN